MRITRSNAVGVIIDIQERLHPHMSNTDDLLENCMKLLKGFQSLNIPTVITQQYTRGLGETIEPIKSLFKECTPVEKSSFSCFDEPAFVAELEKTEKQFILIAGIEAHVCVLQTAIDLKTAGYTPVIIQDCISSRKTSDMKIALKRFHAEGILVSSYESILFELLRTARAEEFKAISAIIK